MYRSRGLSAALSVTFTNLSRGDNQTLHIGDQWRIAVQGPPSQPVTVTGGKDGARDVTPMGSTDATGAFQLSGSIGADQVGSWYEQWQVGGQDAGGFSFTVIADPAPPPHTEPPAFAPPPPAPNVAPVAFPSWLLLTAAGIGALLLFGGRK